MRKHRTTSQLSPLEATLEVPGSALAGPALNAADCVGLECRVHLVQGTEPGGSGESSSLLRSRLRSVALLIFAGFAAFLIWHTIRFSFNSWLSLIVYGTHLAVTLTLASIAVLLGSQIRLRAASLRWIELITFGLPMAFFLLLQYERMAVTSGQYGVLPELSPVWLLMILTYAIFIPNTWQRAAVAVTAMAATPLVGLALTALTHHRVASLLAEDPRVAVETTLLLTLAAVCAIVGVRTINILRDEAHRAKQLGQYKLKRLLGAGGMGEVYLAEHLLMKRPCAIKVIRPDKAGDSKVLARFEREVQATARLSHWNTVDIFDYGRTDDGTFYYVMEYLPGMNLADLVRVAGGPLPAPRAIHLVRQACNALAEAHELGLVHRDIKPANIFAAVRGGRHDVAKLLDFGLAKPVMNVDGAQLTQEGSITGSPLYMSPEQATGEHEPDARSDIYSIGAVLYFLVTGKPPFDDEKPLRVIIAHAHQPPLPPSQLNAAVPDDLEMVVMRCLQKSPQDRYQSAAELVAALEACDDYGRWTKDDARKWWLNREQPAEKAAEDMVVA